MGCGCPGNPYLLLQRGRSQVMLLSLISNVSEHESQHFVEFFTAIIRNKNMGELYRPRVARPASTATAAGGARKRARGSRASIASCLGQPSTRHYVSSPA
jgi:hypothetical protein